MQLAVFLVRSGAMMRTVSYKFWDCLKLTCCTVRMSAPCGESWYFVHFNQTSLWMNVVVVVFALVISVAPEFLLTAALH